MFIIFLIKMKITHTKEFSKSHECWKWWCIYLIVALGR